MEIKEKVEQEIIKFAKKHPRVEAVCFGKLLELNSYLIITEPPYNSKFEDEVTELDIRLTRTLDSKFNIFTLPFGKDHKRNFQNCIYDKCD